VSLSCREIQARLGPYAAEELAAADRRAVREHIAACGDCRLLAVEADPTLLFAGPVPIEDVSAADAARILEGVRAAVAVRQAERRLASSERPRPIGRRRAIIAAAVAAVGLTTLGLPGGPARGVRTPPDGGPSAASVVETPALATASRPSAAAAAAPAGATVYEIAPGRGPNEPRVVWIVDGSLDI